MGVGKGFFFSGSGRNFIQAFNKTEAMLIRGGGLTFYILK
jgi:hypothetical protein